MTLRALLYAYIIGGVTFIPLLLAAIVVPAWYLLPRDEQRKSSGRKENKDNDVGKEGKVAHVRSFSGDAAASGTFAVLRRYDFQAALTALNGRNNSTVAVGGNAVNDGLTVQDNAAYPSNESVYQSVYRTVFTGNRSNGSTSSLLQDQDAVDAVPRRKPAPANLLYIVLRHGHLMLYDSPAQVEVKHVLSLAHHKVTLQAGRDGDEDCMEPNILEADLFTKRTAIVLTPVELPTGTMQTPPPAPVKPFYLFTATNIDKEDFYHALISHRAEPPMPRALDANALVKLQSSLHSSSLTAETRAIDALIGRIFLAVHKTDTLSSFVRGKLEKKLNRIQKPAFIPSLLVQSIHLGDAGPIFSNLKLRDLNIDGEMTLAADMKYNGGLGVTLLAVARLDLGTRFKVRTVDLALKTTIERISGTMLLRIKPPPSNRLWFCFESIPDLEVRVEPVVSERKITYGFVLRAIEERVRTAFKDGLVKPNWDDIPMPFTNTQGTSARGGIWSDLGSQRNGNASNPESATPGPQREAISVLPLSSSTDAGISTGIGLDSGALKARDTKKSTEVGTDRVLRTPRPLRTASVSSSPITALDGQNVEPVRGEDAGRLAQQPRKLWRQRTTATGGSTKDAVEELRDLQSRAEQLMSTSGSNAGVRSNNQSDPDDTSKLGTSDSHHESSSSTKGSDGISKTSTASTRTSSIRSASSSISAATSSSGPDAANAGRKANLLAATVNATTAAKNWSWSAIQRGRNAASRPGQNDDGVAQQPLGRGMPLPPPGQPLPGPQKSLWDSVSSLRRRPVPGPQDSANSSNADHGEGSAQLDTLGLPRLSNRRSASTPEEEFEPWQENSGPQVPEGQRHVPRARASTAIESGPSSVEDFHLIDTQASASAQSHSISSTDRHQGRASPERSEGPTKKDPPPLPARPKRDNNPGSIVVPVQAHAGHASSPSITQQAPEVASETSVEFDSRPQSQNARRKGEPAITNMDQGPSARVPAASTSLAQPESLLDQTSVINTTPKAEPRDALPTAAVLDAAKAADVTTPDSAQSAAHKHDRLGTETTVQVSHEQDISGHDKGDEDADKNHEEKTLARVRKRVEQQSSVPEKGRGTMSQHKTSSSIGFSDGWPSN